MQYIATKNSDMAVVNAAPFCFNKGIAKKFKTILVLLRKRANGKPIILIPTLEQKCGFI